MPAAILSGPASASAELPPGRSSWELKMASDRHPPRFPAFDNAVTIQPDMLEE
jgi:hypothetical protein